MKNARSSFRLTVFSSPRHEAHVRVAVAVAVAVAVSIGRIGRIGVCVCVPPKTTRPNICSSLDVRSELKMVGSIGRVDIDIIRHVCLDLDPDTPEVLFLLFLPFLLLLLLLLLTVTLLLV